MTKLTKLVHNLETGEVAEIELTAAELTEAALQTEAANARLELETTRANQKSALLAKLGITQEEAALLLGGN